MVYFRAPEGWQSSEDVCWRGQQRSLLQKPQNTLFRYLYIIAVAKTCIFLFLKLYKIMECVCVIHVT